MKSTLSRYLIFIVIILFILLVIIILNLNTPLDIQSTIVEIDKGESAYAIAEKLYEQNLIRSKLGFVGYIRLYSLEQDLHYGRYMFREKKSILDVIKKLKKGDVILNAVTIPEGLTIERTARRLTSQDYGEYDRYVSLCYDSTFVYDLTGMELSSLEGFLYPDTYYFPDDISEEHIISHVVQEFFIQTAGLNFDTPYGLTFYEIIILASIVEREAVWDSEKPLIASVYLNRIENGYKLQADPTVAYFLEQQGQTRYKIYYRDLRIPSPYNTYIHHGLPPTPICSPAVSSIRAVLNPKSSDYFFFFASGGGRHEFSKTYSEHLRKLRKYRANRDGN